MLVFASPGRVDEPRSCAVQCRPGFFRLTPSQTCERHSTPTCASNQWLRAGDHARDARCMPCSGCAGQRLLEKCSETADDMCAECEGALGENQLWETLTDAGNQMECVLACNAGFVLNNQTRECEVCASRCAPGLLPPKVRDNCTHCAPCHSKPTNAVWLTQEDRYDCTWECEPKHSLVGGKCVKWTNVWSDSPKVDLLQKTCAAGNTLVDFKCTPCFEAVPQADLPLLQDLGTKWTWIAGCHWQCRHVAGFTALRSATGSSWTCEQDRRRSLILQGPQDSWAAQSPPTGVARGSAKPARTLLSYAALAAVAVPLLLLKCSLLVHCVRRCKRADV